MSTAQHELLNIKQAARILNVSEISIRRWTDAGKLSCLRIGGRRERRFKRQDLFDFLEEQTRSDPEIKEVRSIEDGKSTKILLEGIVIDYSNHLCSLYETDIGRVKLSVPFLADGLRTGDKCFLIASKQIQDDILHSLKEVYPDTKSAIKNARLVLSEGMTSGRDLYDYFEQQFLESTRHGDHYIRVLGDMAWAIDKGMNFDNLMDFEIRYNHSLAKKFAVVSLCQYDARRFSGTEILGALKSHEDTFQFPLSRFIGF